MIGGTRSRKAGHGARLIPASTPTRAGTVGGWTPTCRCGWRGENVPTSPEAKRAYTRHRLEALPICGTCGTTLTPEIQAVRSTHMCKSCVTAKTKAWAEANPDRWERHSRRSWLKQKYGITPEQYDELLARQGGCCAICEEPPSDSRGFRMHVDHDHGTGMVRGILCGPCNRGIGNLRDDPRLLDAGARYLRAHAMYEVSA